MPFESKKQWRKFFAMAGRGEMPMSKAKEWADETKTPYEDLPEKKKEKKAHLEEAYYLGRLMAVKKAGLLKEASLESFLGKAVTNWGRVLAPAGIAAAMVSPEDRATAAILGGLAGAAGSHLLAKGLGKARFTPKELARMGGKSARKLMKESPELYEKIMEAQRAEPVTRWIGSLGGGYGTGALLRKGTSSSSPGIFAEPPATDITTHYTGLLPEEELVYYP